MKKGFTLIELIMVIVIIGILAAIAIPRFMDLNQQAREAACQADVGAIRGAIANWLASYHLNNTCPGAAANCTAAGYPVAAQLAADGTEFANNYFADGTLPDVSHIIDAAMDTWDDDYTVDGSGNAIMGMDICD